MKRLHLRSLAEENKTLEGQFDLSKLERVQDLAINDGETGKYLLKFHLDDAGEIALDGNIRVDVRLVCQRCSQPYTEKLNINMDDFSAEDYDTSVELNQFIEDEILLSLPIIPRHAVEDCNVAPSSSMIGNSKSGLNGGSEKPNPFGALKQLIE